MKKIDESTKVTLTFEQLKKLVKEGRYTNAPTPDKQKKLNKLFIAGFKELFDTISRYFVDSTVFNGGYYAVVNTNDGVQSILTCFKEIAKAAGDIMIDDEEADNIDEIVNKIENQANQICKGSDDEDAPTTVSEDDEGPADVDTAVKDLFDMYRACKVEPKVCNAIKADGEKTNIFLGRGNSVGGIAKALRDGRLLKVIGFN